MQKDRQDQNLRSRSLLVDEEDFLETRRSSRKEHVRQACQKETETRQMQEVTCHVDSMQEIQEDENHRDSQICELPLQDIHAQKDICMWLLTQKLHKTPM